MDHWTVRLHPRAFSKVRRGLDINFFEEAEAVYVYEALERAGERVELCEETRVEVVRRRG